MDLQEYCYPLSSMQALFWRMHTGSPASTNHLILKGFRVKGEINVSVLRLAFEKVIEKHQLLRTIFLEREGGLLQCVRPHMLLDWAHEKIDSLHDLGDIWGLRKVFQDFLSHPFDLENGPLIRVRLLEAGSEDFLLQIAVHHIVSDRSTMLLMLQDVSNMYNDLTDGREPHIEASRFNIGAYAKQEIDWLAGKDGSAQLRYWLDRLQNKGFIHEWPSWKLLANISETTPLPAGVYEFGFEDDTWTGIRALSEKFKISRFQVILGAYFLTLQKMLSGKQVTVGVAMDMRRLLGDRSLAGCLINLMPVSVDGDAPNQVDEYLLNAARSLDEAIGHARVPYPAMLEAWIKTNRDFRTSRWSTLFNIKDTDSGSLTLNGCNGETLHEFLNEILLQDPSSDLNITMVRTPGDKGSRGIHMLIRYDERVLSHHFVALIVQSWESVLKQCIAVPKAETGAIMLPGVAGRYAQWQERLSMPGIRESLETYWEGRLSQLKEPVIIIPELKSSKDNTGRFERVSSLFDARIHQQIESYGRNESLSRFAVWLAIWQILHSRLGTGEEVIVATPVSERDRPEWQDILGMCLNTLPIRTQVDEQASFRSFCRTNQDRLSQDLAHGQLPYEDIIRLADGEPGTDGQGMPQVMFVWHDKYERMEEDGDASAAFTKPMYAKNPITVHLIDRTDDCRIVLEYDANLFAEQTAVGILRRFEKVAHQVMKTPDTRLSELDILLPGEREQLRALSGLDNLIDFPGTTLHEIFHRTAGQFPDHPAVIASDGSVTTYAQMQEQIKKVASFLLKQGIEPEAVVAVHLRRSSDLLATMLGISQAGGAFFLMEPSLPTERLRTMAEQSRVAAIITEEGMPDLPGFTDISHRLDVVMDTAIIEYGTKSVTGPASLACVIFTSGSTGIPKGAMLEQENLYNYLFFLRNLFKLSSEVRTLHKTTLSFDPCFYEMLLPMTCGGAVVMAATGLENDSQHMVDMVECRQSNYLFFAPGQLRLFLQHPDLHLLNGKLKIIQCAGEALDEALMVRCLSSMEAILSNAYGPAEAGAVTQWICHIDHAYPKPSIGPANCNVDIWIMDRLGRPLPPGMTGELWIGGAQTGRGYINNEAESRKRFVDDPFNPGSGRRYYRTGDLAQFLPDGNLLFHGRMDDQLKVRGVRVELGDVSTALNRCAGVMDAVVLAEPDGEGSNRLRAWVTAKEGMALNESSLHADLSGQLPAYMIPFRIHVIDTIPMTPHGKTDHRALRAMAAQAGDGTEGLPLITSTEHRLAQIWTELLGVEVGHRDAHFFRLGGHSLLAMRMAGRIRGEFQATVSLPDFYTDGRLDRLAARIDAEQHPQDRSGWMLSDMPALSPGERVPMSWSQRRMWMLQELLPHPSSYHIALMPGIPGFRTASDVRSMLQWMAEHHGILRTRLFQDEDGFWQEELPVDQFQMDWEEVEAAAKEACVELMTATRERVFDLSKAPGWRARWIQMADGTARLLLVFHHALVDEWSMNMFSGSFDALLTGKSSATMEERPSYRYIDFSRWQHWTFSKGLREQLEGYWSERLSNLGSPIRLLTDHHPAEGTSGRSAAVTRPLAETTRSLMDAYCRREGLSRFAVWMAVWQILHARLGNGEEVVVATPVSERDRPEWQEVMGMCLNTLPIRMKVDEQSTFRSFSRANHRTLASDLGHGQLPYEDIIRLADGELGIDGEGLPQVMFVWHGEYEWGGEEGSSDIPGAKYVKNPISFHLTDRRNSSLATIE